MNKKWDCPKPRTVPFFCTVICYFAVNSTSWPLTVSMSYSKYLGRFGNASPAFGETIGFFTSAEHSNLFGHSPSADFKPLPLSSTLERIRSVPSIVDLMLALTSLPLLHFSLTIKPPRARNPTTLPSLQASGSAGSK